MELDNSQILKINEIFYSIQGESTYAGLPCIFVRLAYCNLRCSWCDTTYAFYEGKDQTFKQILAEIECFNCRLIEITGGEPLLQNNVLPFMKQLCDANYEVLLETGGHMDISQVDPRVKRIMDIKCPSSGEVEKNHWDNIRHIKTDDQIKFVLAGRSDYDWAKSVLQRYNLTDKCPVLLSPVFGRIDSKELAQWILQDGLKVRLQIQLHKIIWSPEARGV